MSGYEIVSSGELKRILNSPFATGGGPYAAAIDPTGQFLYVTNYGAATVSGYIVGSNGGLTAIPGSPFTTGNSPGSMAITAQ